jgi:hypothetical protein
VTLRSALTLLALCAALTACGHDQRLIADIERAVAEAMAESEAK